MLLSLFGYLPVTTISRSALPLINLSTVNSDSCQALQAVLNHNEITSVHKHSLKLNQYPTFV